jgi:hypothetical protein
VNQVTSRGASPLLLASQEGRIDAVESLLQAFEILILTLSGTPDSEPHCWPFPAPSYLFGPAQAKGNLEQSDEAGKTSLIKVSLSSCSPSTSPSANPQLSPITNTCYSSRLAKGAMRASCSGCYK